MSCPSHEHLLGYVLGALEPREHEQLEHELAKDPELARQVAALSARLQPLECCREVEAPPAGLATRTCAAVYAHVGELEKVTPARRGVAAAMSTEYGDPSSRWSLSDLVVAAGIFMAAGMLFFPAIANSRYQAQVAQCQNNQRLYGEAMQRGQSLHPELHLMNVANMPGERAVAGIQTMLLKDYDLLPRDSIMICPGSPEAEESRGHVVHGYKAYQQAPAEQRGQIERAATGSLALPLGHRNDESADDLSSEFVAIASDAPSGAVPNLVSNHHDGKGQNVVFASGRTAYICGCGDKDCGDSLFWNRDLKIEAGLDVRDNVLARGGTRAFAMPVININN
jgi:hypothetical protein